MKLRHSNCSEDLDYVFWVMTLYFMVQMFACEDSHDLDCGLRWRSETIGYLWPITDVFQFSVSYAVRQSVFCSRRERCFWQDLYSSFTRLEWKRVTPYSTLSRSELFSSASDSKCLPTIRSAAMFTSTMKSTQCHDPEGCSLKLTDMYTLTCTVFHIKLKGTRSRFSSYHIGFVCDEMDLSSRGVVCGFPHKNRRSSKMVLKFVQLCNQCTCWQLAVT